MAVLRIRCLLGIVEHAVNRRAVGRLQLSGPAAWLTWLLVHIYYLIGAHNRLIVLTRWMFSLTTRAGDARLIIGVPTAPGRPTDSIEGEGVLRTTLGVPRRS